MAYVIIILFSFAYSTAWVLFPMHTLVITMGLYLAMLVILDPPQGGPY